MWRSRDPNWVQEEIDIMNKEAIVAAEKQRDAEFKARQRG